MRDTNLHVPSSVSDKDITSTRNLLDSTTHNTKVTDSHSQNNSSGSLEREILLSKDQSMPAYASISDRPPLPLPEESALSVSDSSLEFSATPTPVTSIRHHLTLPWWNRSLKRGRTHQLETTSGDYINEGMGPLNSNAHNNPQ